MKNDKFRSKNKKDGEKKELRGFAAGEKLSLPLPPCLPVPQGCGITRGNVFISFRLASHYDAMMMCSLMASVLDHF